MKLIVDFKKAINMNVGTFDQFINIFEMMTKIEENEKARRKCEELFDEIKSEADCADFIRHVTDYLYGITRDACLFEDLLKIEGRRAWNLKEAEDDAKYLFKFYDRIDFLSFILNVINSEQDVSDFMFKLSRLNELMCHQFIRFVSVIKAEHPDAIDKTYKRFMHKNLLNSYICDNIGFVDYLKQRKQDFAEMTAKTVEEIKAKRQ